MSAATLIVLVAGVFAATLMYPAADAATINKAFPYELAFDRHEFPSRFVVSSDGNLIAYPVRSHPPEANLEAGGFFSASGAPNELVGSRILIADRKDGSTVDACHAAHDTAWGPSWSPDGRRLAFYSDADGQPRLWVREMLDGKCRQVSSVVIKAHAWSGGEAQWSPDNQTLYVPIQPQRQTEDESSPQVPPVTFLRSGGEKTDPRDDGIGTDLTSYFLKVHNAAIAAVDVLTGEVRVVVPAETEPRPSVLRISPSGRWISYLSVLHREERSSAQLARELAVVPTAGGDVRTLDEGLPMLASDLHHLNYRWHPREDRLVYWKDHQLWLVDFGPEEPSAPRQLARELGRLAPTVYWFTRDGKAIVVGTSPKDEKSRADPQPRGLAVVPLDGGQPIDWSIDEQRWNFVGILKADARTIWQPDGTSITFQLRDRATGENAIVRFDPRSRKIRLLWQGVARFGNLTSGGNHDFIVGIYEDYATPPDLYRFAGDLSRKERVSHIEPRLDDVKLGKVEIFESTVPLHDGALGRVRTAVLLPPGAARGDKLPAIVMVYPGADFSRSAEEFGGGTGNTVPNVVFTSRGYAVVLPHLKLGPTGEPGNVVQEMVDGLLPQVYRAAELGYVDVERLAISGQSGGGCATAAIVSRTNLFRAAVPVNGCYDLPGFNYAGMSPGDNSGMAVWEASIWRLGTHPWSNLLRYTENSPYYQADKIFTPLLIVAGGEDAGYRDSWMFFAALERLGRQAEFVSYAGEGHVILSWTRRNAVDVSRRMVEFFEQYLKATDPSLPVESVRNARPEADTL